MNPHLSDVVDAIEAQDVLQYPARENEEEFAEDTSEMQEPETAAEYTIDVEPAAITLDAPVPAEVPAPAAEADVPELQIKTGGKNEAGEPVQAVPMGIGSWDTLF